MADQCQLAATCRACEIGDLPRPPGGEVLALSPAGSRAGSLLGLVGFLLKSWLEKVDSRLEKLDARIESLTTQQARVEERITSLEKKS